MHNKSLNQSKEIKVCHDIEEKEIIEEKNNMNDKELDKISKGGLPEKLYNCVENITTTIIKTIIFLYFVDLFTLLFGSFVC